LGLSYAFIHAAQIVDGITTPAGVTSATEETLRRVLEANQSYAVLTLFYVFAFVMIICLGLIIAWPKFSQARNWGTWPATILALVLIPLVGIFIDSSNLRIIQADIVYKRADPWDRQAGRGGDSALWANAIAIYERAIDLAPVEDFYYLWLGRAYLERSNVTEDLAERNQLLFTAEDRLLEAQRINPLNTDHTANLARLNTRWAESVAEEERAERIDISAGYYEGAMSLSPNNAVIINEYARLSYLLAQDCEKSMALYDHSVATDPYYTSTYFDRAEIFGACAEQAAEEDRITSYARAADSLKEALNREPGDPRNWVRLADYYVRSGQTDEAVEAYKEAKERAGDAFPLWELEYQMSRRFLEVENPVLALEFAERALELAPPDARGSVEQLRQMILADEPEPVD
jgi:tetratricopeptide (TPR) repeat protein